MAMADALEEVAALPDPLGRRVAGFAHTRQRHPSSRRVAVPARGGGRGLRGPAQRDRRRRGRLREVGQRLRAAGRQPWRPGPDAAIARRAGRGCRGCGRHAGRAASASVEHHRSGGGRRAHGACAAWSTCSCPAVARALSAIASSMREGSRHRDGNGQLPRVRAIPRPTSIWRANIVVNAQVPPLRRVQRLRDAARRRSPWPSVSCRSCSACSPTRACASTVTSLRARPRLLPVT